MLRWAVDQAYQAGMNWARLDVYREAARLREWYAAQGWEPVRETVVPGKRSGALFRRRAEPDREAREMFSGYLDWVTNPHRAYKPGTRVLTDGHGAGRVAVAPESAEGWPQRNYVVELDTGEIASFRETSVAMLLRG